ncbi:MAG: Hsp20 family protein [Candidatus Moranbacteria bacterium]|nr:Hsp20 family protein [Candidatus Moranbacteria bacterium]
MKNRIIKPKRNQEQSNPQMYTLRDAMSRLFDESVWQPFGGAVAFNADFPQLDISEDKDNVKVTADVPGIDMKNINIEVEDDYMIISGKQEKEKVTEEENVYREERSYGEFRREFVLPASVEADKVKAKLKDGVLKIEMPKAEKAKAKKIAIEKE